MFRITQLARPLTLIAASFGVACAIGFATAPTAHTVTYLTAATATAPALRCVTPAAPAGTTITVDAHGDASAPAQPGRLDFACVRGTWVRITIPRALPSWLHARRIPDACGRGHAGVMLYASGADQSVVVCKNGAVEPS